MYREKGDREVELVRKIWMLTNRDTGYEVRFVPDPGPSPNEGVKLVITDLDTGELVVQYPAKSERELTAHIEDAWRRV